MLTPLLQLTAYMVIVAGAGLIGLELILRRDRDMSALHIDLKGGWHVNHNPKPVPDRSHDWDFYHDNWDGADGGNGLAGTGADVADCINQIAEIVTEKGMSL